MAMRMSGKSLMCVSITIVFSVHLASYLLIAVLIYESDNE